MAAIPPGACVQPVSALCADRTKIVAACGDTAVRVWSTNSSE